jgi:hypothetical protein
MQYLHKPRDELAIASDDAGHVLSNCERDRLGGKERWKVAQMPETAYRTFRGQS